MTAARESRTRLADVDDYPKLIVVAAGPSECGKTRALHDLFLVHAPRRLSIDFNSEMHRKYGAEEVFSIAELRDKLADVAGRERWHVALCTSPDSIPEMAPELSRILNPARTSREHRSYSRLVGGVMVDCSEARNLMPNLKVGWASDTIAWAERGRHNALSLGMATQSPQSVERRLTDSANHLLAFRTQEDAVWNYWRKTTSARVADIIGELPQYHCAWIVKDEQRVYVLDAGRECYSVVDYKGNEVDDQEDVDASDDVDDTAPEADRSAAAAGPAPQSARPVTER